MEIFPEDWRRALFIVAHPDDPEYGAAAAVARWTDQGKEITYLLVTRGEAGIDSLPPAEAGPLRAEEQVRAAAEVGVDTVEFLDGHTDGVIEYGIPLRRDLAEAVRRHRPDLVLGINQRATWPGGGLNMADHTAVGRAIPDACRDAANRWVFADQLGADLEPWDDVRKVAFAASPEPTHAVDVSATWEQGERSLAQHHLYLDSVGAPDYLRPMAQHEGEGFGCELAVSWEVIDL